MVFSPYQAPHPSLRRVNDAIRHLRENRYDALGTVDCLRCGSKNLMVNRICGACGASLPRILDEDGSLRRGINTRIRSKLSPVTRKVVWLAILALFVMGAAGIYRGCSHPVPGL